MAEILKYLQNLRVKAIDLSAHDKIISLTLAGAMNGGPIGGIIGFNIGLIDDLLTNPHHGVAPYASITFSILGGAVIGGQVGGLIGLNVGLTDEFLITHQYTKKHYFSMSAFHSSMTFMPWASAITNILPINYKLPIELSAFALSAAASYYTDDFIDFHHKIELPLESFSTLYKIFEEKEILSQKEVNKIYNEFLVNPKTALDTIKNDALEIYNNPFLANFGTSSAISISKLIIDNLYIYYLGSYAGGLFISIYLNQNHNYKESLIIFKFLKYVVDAVNILSIHSIKLYADKQIISMQKTTINEYDILIIEKASNLLLSKGNSRKVISINEKDGKQSIEYIAKDLFALLDGANKLITVSTNSLAAIISLNILVKYAPDIILPYMTFSLMPRQKILKDIIPESQKTAEESADALMQAVNFFGDIKKRSEEIDLRDGGEFIKNRFNIEWKRFKQANLKSTEIESSISHMYNAVDIHDKIIDLLYFVSKFYLGTIELGDIPLIYNATDIVTDFLSSNLDSQKDNIEIGLSKKRINNFLNWSNTTSINAHKSNNEDGNIVFKNYSLHLNEKLLVHIDHLELQRGKHYAFTGKKGCGKSTTLTDLKEGVVGSFSSTGEIEYPFEQKITFLNQKLYMPESSTLLETLHFPKTLDILNPYEILAAKEIAKKLLKDLGLEKFIAYFDSKTYKTSGGELKTFGLIQALIANPDILILDESLNELDSLSVFKTLEAIATNLPKTTVILVTHNANSQNFNNFIHEEVHFANATVTIRNIKETPITSEMEHYLHYKNDNSLTSNQEICEAFSYFQTLSGTCLADWS